MIYLRSIWSPWLPCVFMRLSSPVWWWWLGRFVGTSWICIGLFCHNGIGGTSRWNSLVEPPAWPLFCTVHRRIRSINSAIRIQGGHKTKINLLVYVVRVLECVVVEWIDHYQFDQLKYKRDRFSFMKIIFIFMQSQSNLTFTYTFKSVVYNQVYITSFRVILYRLSRSFVFSILFSDRSSRYISHSSFKRMYVECI